MSLLKKIFTATATYGQGFTPISLSGEFSIRIYVGGFAGPNTADERFNIELEKFLIEKNYKSYKLISRRYNFIPSYFEYIVAFNNNTAT
jgi:hypothetical protein